MTTPAPPLLPRWFGVTAVLAFAALAAGMGLAGLLNGGLVRTAALLLAVTCLLVDVAAVRALLWPRRRQALPPGPDGVTVIRSPALIAWSLVLAWATGLAAAAVWAAVVLLGLSSLEDRRWSAVALTAFASLPDLYRLLTGRLHRWELTLGPDGYRYRGYRTDRSGPWSEVRGASIQQRGSAGVLIERKGTGPGVVVPAAAFGVPAEQVVEEVRAHLGPLRRR